VIGGVVSALISLYFSKKSEAQIKRLSDSVFHNLRADVFLGNVRSGDDFQLYWEVDRNRLLSAHLKREGADVGTNHYFKPDDWTEEKMRQWRREHERWLRQTRSDS
jgi:hypothetical protein